MSYYRDTYLKSEDWRNLRSAVIAVAAPDGKCNLCKENVATLDVHHIKYRHLYDALPWEMRAICRICHDKVHDLLKRFPKLLQYSHRRQWTIIRSRASKNRKTCLLRFLNAHVAHFWLTYDREYHDACAQEVDRLGLVFAGRS